MSLMNTASKYSNLIFAAIYAYAIRYDYYLSETYNIWPVPGKYWSKIVWLTMINLYFQFFYNSIAAVFALANVQNPSLLRQFHYFATALIFPTSLTVVALFWGLVYLDPNFLIDDAAKIILAVKWFNHTIHTLPLLAMLWDFVLWRHPRPEKRDAFDTILSFVVLYIIDIHYFYYVHGFWAYPILATLPTLRRILFLLFCSVVVFAAFLIGDAFNALIGSKFTPTPLAAVAARPNRNRTRRGRAAAQDGPSKRKKK